jgi:WhiB family redox-sensing transcriptional regulator
LNTQDELDWMNRAECKKHPRTKFDATPGMKTTVLNPMVKEAKAICQRCPVRVECQEFGMDEEFGIFGGLLPLERKALRDEREKYAADGRAASAG